MHLFTVRLVGNTPEGALGGLGLYSAAEPPPQPTFGMGYAGAPGGGASGGVGGPTPLQNMFGASNLFANAPTIQPMPGFLSGAPTTSGVPGVPFQPFTGAALPPPAPAKPAPPPGHLAGSGGMTTPIASSTQTGARNVRARLEIAIWPSYSSP